MAERHGQLVLVVGPSGVGKDTLINGAQAQLAGDPRFAFVRRIVTRPADAALEDHDTMDEALFDALEAGGGLALSWRAHGLRYGLPAGIFTDLAAGKVVVANGSRQALGQGCKQFPGCAVVLVTARSDLRAQRLLQRGRENPDQIAARLRREAAALPDGIEPMVIDNSGTQQQGIAAMLGMLRLFAGQIPSA